MPLVFVVPQSKDGVFTLERVAQETRLEADRIRACSEILAQSLPQIASYVGVSLEHQEYLGRTNILSTRFEGENDGFELIDFMPRYKTEGGYYHTPPDIVRYIRNLVRGTRTTSNLSVGGGPRAAAAAGARRGAAAGALRRRSTCPGRGSPSRGRS